MEAFGDTRAFPREPVNIHEVLDRVRKVAQTSFARDVTFTEVFDPSLPPVLGDRDQLIQVFLNLVRNAADARAGNRRRDHADHRLSARRAHQRRSGRRRALEPAAGSDRARQRRRNSRRSDAAHLRSLRDHQAARLGLGLALVAKIIGDHGGVIECDSVPRRTVFRVLLPKAGVLEEV